MDCEKEETIIDLSGYEIIKRWMFDKSNYDPERSKNGQKYALMMTDRYLSVNMAALELICKYRPDGYVYFVWDNKKQEMLLMPTCPPPRRSQKRPVTPAIRMRDENGQPALVEADLFISNLREIGSFGSKQATVFFGIDQAVSFEPHHVLRFPMWDHTTMELLPKESNKNQEEQAHRLFWQKIEQEKK